MAVARARATVLLVGLTSAALAWLVLTYDRGSRCDAAVPDLLLPAAVVVALVLTFGVGQSYDCFTSTEG